MPDNKDDINEEVEQRPKDIYDLELHELTRINGFCDVMKAPDGWFYIFYANEDWDPETKRWRTGNIRAVHYIKE